MNNQYQLFNYDPVIKYRFSGHHNYYCKRFWLKKAYDFIKDKNQFNNPNAALKLGVGNSAVEAIKFWAESFGVLDSKHKISNFGEFLFSDKGVDPFLEDIGSLWLLHLKLIKEQKASLVNIFFNHIRRKHQELSLAKIKSEVKYYLSKVEKNIPNSNTLESDIKVLINTYFSKSTPNDFENYHDGVLHELRLFQVFDKNKIHLLTKDYTIPDDIFFYTILDCFPNRNSISIEEIIVENNSPGIIFCLNEDCILKKIENITEKFSGLILSEYAGVKELQIKESYNKKNILINYYNSQK